MLHPGCDVEVRCHPGCPWVSGWEVVDVVLVGGAAEYRIRRRGQPHALSTLLPSADVRPLSELEVSQAS